MKLFWISLFLSLIAGSFAALASGDFKDSAHPGKCVYEGKVLSPGEDYTPKGQCYRFSCGEDGQGQIAVCGIEVAGPPCRLGDFINPNASYPDCCPRKTVCP